MKHYLITILSLCLLLTSCRPTLHRIAGQAQGTYYSIVYYDRQQREVIAQVDSLLNDFDLTASLWIDSSEICRFNRCPDSMTVSPRFADLYQKSIEIQELTDGAFDCHVGQLVSAYGFARSKGLDLDDRAIDSLQAICRAPLHIDTLRDGTIVMHKSNPNTCLDFNAIAQGYSVDMLCAMFDQMGITDYIIDVGGEVRARGCKADNEPWIVGVERPTENRDDDRTVEIALPLHDQSIVTSGSYRKYYERNGIRYSHTIDPSTGRPVMHSTLSASVIDSTAWRADALATAFMVMGYQRGTEWLKSHPEIDAVFFIYDNDGQYLHYATPHFSEMIME